MFINKSRIPPELLDKPGVAVCERAIQEVWASPECRWACCVHEAAHAVYYRQAGSQGITLHAPIVFFRDGRFTPGFLSVSGDEAQMSLKQFARMMVAGNIAGSLLPAHHCSHCHLPLDLTQSIDFEDFMSSGKAPLSELRNEWNAAEQEVEKELRYKAGAWNEVVGIAKAIESFVMSNENESAAWQGVLA